VHDFNHCVLIDLVPIPIDDRTSMDGVKKTEMMKKLHKQVRSHIEKKTTKYVKHAIIKGEKWLDLSREILFGFILAKIDFQASESSN
jgi:hypothetical protein